MKLFCALTVLAAAAFATVNPQLHQVKRVYILAMGSGMDQFLANQLTKEGVFEVVTDPKRADAIVTDNVGEAFQKKLDDLYPPPPKPKTEAAATSLRTQARRSMSAMALPTQNPPGRIHSTGWISRAALFVPARSDAVRETSS